MASGPSQARPGDPVPENAADPYQEDAPPPYGEVFGRIDDQGDDAGTTADIADDGRVNIRIDQKTKGLSSLLVPALRSQLDLVSQAPQPHPVPPGLAESEGRRKPPKFNVVIHVVGSRGDVQPFVAIGKVLKEQYGHRVRLATHPVFKQFVKENGLEFFNISGDPSELMAFMVKNPGLMPGFDTLRRGDVGKRRKEIGNMVKRCWRSCIEAGDGSGVEATDKNVEDWASIDSGVGMEPDAKPFVADAIIANPPSFAHVHCAEKLGIPLHMMFTMPWSPTQSFPHPLANIQSTNADTNMTNFMSYALVDMMTWQGLGDVMNSFREKSLGLEPIDLTTAPGMLARMHIPYTYCWSPALIPKPRDWGPYIDVAGFYFLSLGSSFTPEPDLAAFLENGPPPVYIGFGSIVVDDPDGMTKLIFDAVRKSGQRALVSKGWGGFGAEQMGLPDGVFMLGNVPHDWLFKKVSCVVHHGGAGTTAAGIACGRPTVIVPFFGDQPFWGHMVARAGAGPKPIPYKQLNASLLAESISEALKPSSLDKAKELSEKIRHETGSETGSHSFHRQLNIDNMRCQLSPKRTAVWRVKRTEVRLSAFAATVLGNGDLLDPKELKLYRPREHDTDYGPPDPITGGASALVGTMGNMAMGVADLPVAALKALKIHPDAKKPKPAADPGPKADSDSKEGSVPLHDLDKKDQKADEEKPGSVADPSATPHPEDNEDDGQQQEMAHAIGQEMAAQNEAAQKEHAAKAEEQDKQGAKKSSEAPQQGAASASSAEAAPEKKTVDKADIDTAIGTGKGAFKFVSAGIKSPMDFTLNLAKGFHNAPKLYGDETVRKPEKITDFSSGVRAASKEFGYGFYDGISGLVTQPIEGAKKGGAEGFIKGFGKGIGGIVFKPGAAIWGIPGYTSKGMYKELHKRFGPSVDGYIIAARTAQGYEEVTNSSEAERQQVIEDWKEMRRFIHKKKTLGEDQMRDFQTRIHAREDVDDSAAQRTDGMLNTGSSGVYSPSPSSMNMNPLSRVHTSLHPVDEKSSRGDEKSQAHTPDTSVRSSPLESVASTTLDPGRAASTSTGAEKSQGDQYDPELEEAIRRSVAETSRGDPAQDAAIESAIRASMKHLEQARQSGAEEDELRRGLQASLQDNQAKQSGATGGGAAAAGSSSSTAGQFTPNQDTDDEEVERAMRESKEAHEKMTGEEKKALEEEETVLKYVMKQSEAEEKLRRERGA